jgi:hypothetical protein
MQAMLPPGKSEQVLDAATDLTAELIERGGQ